MATLNAARLLGIESTRGTIAVGKQASLIMLDENPVDDLDALWQLSGVIHDSLWLPIDELEKKLAAQVARFPADSD